MAAPAAPQAEALGNYHRSVATPSPLSAAAAPEIEWARRLLEGDASGFTPFVESIQQRVFQYTWLMCGQREDAEEVAQETLLKVFENFDQLQDPARVRA